MNKRIIIFLLISVVLGCTTVANYRERVNSWIGETEKNLIVKWGYPDDVLDISDSSKLYKYYSESVFPGNNYSPTPLSDSKNNKNVMKHGIYDYEYVCSTFFNIDKNTKIIKDVSFKGNDCTSR